MTSRLIAVARNHRDARLASSLSVEDMLLTDIIFNDLGRARETLSVFTLETGLLHRETRELLEESAGRYPGLMTVYEPDREKVAAYVTANGVHAFYDSLELRHGCCALRKVEPLNRALQGADAWITGQRRQQASTRIALPLVEDDRARNIRKYNPLADWSEAEVWAAAKTRNVPVNTLYHKGYPSIGCEPCTIAVKAGEDIRSGRWWWEQSNRRECGLHVPPAPAD
ncbi:MAG: phosphoadenylyl-sulfate reductase [Methylobacteriaceae bacterium]|nr:phosphoadenylyl-sulfate reductase [Methylobacteriaceae bacterium]